MSGSSLFSLQGEWALVTGGTRGIGRGCVRLALPGSEYKR